MRGYFKFWEFEFSFSDRICIMCGEGWSNGWKWRELRLKPGVTCSECDRGNVTSSINSANVCVRVCVCVCVCLSRVLQGLEMQPELPVLSAHRGHTRLSEPPAGEAWVRRHLWGPLSQLHSGTSASSLLPTHLRPGAGAIQGGEAVTHNAPCTQRQWIQNAFRTLHLFHYLFCCSRTHTLFKFKLMSSLCTP